MRAGTEHISGTHLSGMYLLRAACIAPDILLKIMLSCRIIGHLEHAMSKGMDVSLSCRGFAGKHAGISPQSTRDAQAAKRFFAKALAAPHTATPHNHSLLRSLDGATGRRKKSVILPLVERTMQHHHMAGQRGDTG